MPILCCILFALFVVSSVLCAINNVCPTINDYYTIADNPNCWYDISAEGNVTDIISKNGYQVQTIKAVTPDGYILSIFRIPGRDVKGAYSEKGPVFLLHGLHGTATNFVSKGKDSLAFLLADSGYDVWLGNCRGSEYSEEHTNMTINDRKYWDVSADEIGLYDIPTQLKVVADNSGNRGNIVYIAHSLGTSVGMIYSSSYPSEAKKLVKLFIYLAPVAEIPNTKSPVKLVAPLANAIFTFIRENDLIRITSQAKILRNILRTVCFESPSLLQQCFSILNLFNGAKTQIGTEMIPVYLNQYPGGASIKIINHASSMMLNFFGHYDYGIDNNAKYRSFMPPRYQVEKIQVPVYLIYALGDWVATKKDTQTLFKKLEPQAKVYGLHEVPYKDFNHIDFLYGKNAKALVYDHILNLLKKTK